MRWLSWSALISVTALGCGNSAHAPDAAPTASAPITTAAPTATVAVTDAGAHTDAGAGAEAAADAGAGADAGARADADAGAEMDAGAPFAADNKVAPTEGPELQERARALFDAIVKNDAKIGESFWFPKEPFIPLKDIKDPGKYWEQLHRTYAADVRALHKKRKSWDGATFVRFDVGSKPKWVKPGDEANKIGYYRSFHGSLRYEQKGKEHTIDVHTVITWQGRWYITHLRKFKK